MTPIFSWEVERQGRTTVVFLRGELDLASAEAALDVLIDALREGDLVIDASELSFIDSSGIRSILEAYREANQGIGAGRGVTVRAPTAQVRRVLQLTGIDNLIEEQAQT
jgi:anti-sigma B factor antagonist